MSGLFPVGQRFEPKCSHLGGKAFVNGASSPGSLPHYDFYSLFKKQRDVEGLLRHWFAPQSSPRSWRYSSTQYSEGIKYRPGHATKCLCSLDVGFEDIQISRSAFTVPILNMKTSTPLVSQGSIRFPRQNSREKDSHLSKLSKYFHQDRQLRLCTG